MNKDTSPIHKGRCLCGAVTYEVAGTPVVVAQCHCINCQRGSGTGHTTGAMYPVDRFRLAGEIAEFKFTSEHGNEVARLFCPKCGSPILGRNSGMIGFVTITLGTLDEAAEFRPQVAIFARSRMPWDVTDDTLPTFDVQPDWKPEKGGV